MKTLIKSGLLFIFLCTGANTFGAQLECASVTEHRYLDKENTLAFALDRMIQTKDGKKVKVMRTKETSDKLKVKLAITRPGSLLCFKQITFLQQDDLIPLTSGMLLVQAQDLNQNNIF
jgi:hypothetical protein